MKQMSCFILLIWIKHKNMDHDRLTFLLYLLFHYVIGIQTLRNYLTPKDREHLTSVFRLGIEKEELSAIHYGATGLVKLLNVELENELQVSLCLKIKHQIKSLDLKNIYHVTGILNVLARCRIELNVEKLESKIKQTIGTAEKINSRNIYCAIEIAKNLQIKQIRSETSQTSNEKAYLVDQIQLEKVLTASFKTNSRTSYIYSFASLFVLEKTLARKHFFRAEELMSQADEVDGKFLRFEGGLTLTGLAVHSIYNLSKAAHKAPSLSEKQIVLLSNYLLSRKGVTDERGGFYLLTALLSMANDNLLTSVAVTLSSSKVISQDEKELKICNVVGDPLLVNSVVLVSATHLPSKTITENTKNLKMTKDINDKTDTIYQICLNKNKLITGRHKLVFVVSIRSILFSHTKTSFVVNIMGYFHVPQVFISLFDVLTKQQAKVSVNSDEKFAKIFHLTDNKKLNLEFAVSDKSTYSVVQPHQVFLLFAHSKSGEEVGFLILFDKAINSYSFTLDMKNFSGRNGKYRAYLIVGDSLMKNPINWNIFDVFVDLSKKKTKAKAVGTARKLSNFAAETVKPDFSASSNPKPHHHLSFGQKLTSCVFTVFCSAPLFFILVIRLFFGANFNSFKKPLCVWALCFHSCLFVIFVLYSLFWLYYSHITTLLKQVFVVGIAAFVCGNQLLHRLAINRKEESGEESESEVEEQQSERELEEKDEVESDCENEDYDLESDEKTDFLAYKMVDKDNSYVEFAEDKEQSL